MGRFLPNRFKLAKIALDTSCFMAERPEPPAVDTEAYDRWKQSATINFSGGYLEATYGNLIQTFEDVASSGITGTRAVTRKKHDRVNTIGGAVTEVEATTYTQAVIPRRNSSGAAGGQPITIITPVGKYSARLGGDIQDFVAFIEDPAEVMVIDNMSFLSERGADYGPFVNTSA
jgi:hypothetical protein